jgi:hypothetical protein
MASLEQDLARVVANAIKSAVRPLEERIAALEPLAERVRALEVQPRALEYKGSWSSEAPVHQRGDAVTEKGGVWICLADTRTRPGESRDWQLAVRAGRDAR